MTINSPSDIDLMERHIEAIFTHDEAGRVIGINALEGGTPPRFFLGRTAAGHLWRFGKDVPNALAHDLEALCRKEPITNPVPRAPAFEAEYLRLVSFHGAVERVWNGPDWLLPEEVGKSEATPINASTAHLLESNMADWLPDVGHSHPFMAAVEKGRAVSVCASVRITAEAHEAGVETIPACRRKGHAATAVRAWARAVSKTGALPLYSTSWDNLASQAVAASLGAAMYGTDFSIT